MEAFKKEYITKKIKSSIQKLRKSKARKHSYNAGLAGFLKRNHFQREEIA